MAETAVKSEICDICGAEVRSGSLFCYNCGGSVTKQEILPIAEDEAKATNGNAVESAAYNPAKRREESSKTRKVRASNRQPVEIEWEPRTTTSWPFIIGSLVFLLFSFLILFAALYVR